MVTKLSKALATIKRQERIIDDFCDFALVIGIFRGRDHDIQTTVDLTWVGLRKRAGRLFKKHGKRYEANLKRGFVTWAGNPSNPMPYHYKQALKG